MFFVLNIEQLYSEYNKKHFFTLINPETRRAYYIRSDMYYFLKKTIFLKTVDEGSIGLWECSWWTFKKFKLLQGGKIECWNLQLFVGGLMSYSRYLCLFVVSNTYCVLFLFYFSSTCVPYVVSFSGLSILIAPFIFSDVYFQCALCFLWKYSWHHVSDCDFAWLIKLGYQNCIGHILPGNTYCWYPA
jgi:hypothetical protein